MAKLLNKKTIQYIKQGYVLYGQPGLKVDMNKFYNWYRTSNSIKSTYKSFYEKVNPKPIDKNPEFPLFYNEELNEYNKTFEENFLKFLNDNFIKSDGTYYKKTSDYGKLLLFALQLLPTKYPNYFRDSLGQLYKRKTGVYDSDKGFSKISEDIKYGDKIILKAIEPPTAQKVSSGNSGKNDEILKEATRNGYARPHKYLQGEVEYYNVTLGDGKTKRWAAKYIKPTPGQNPGWWWVAEGSTGYDHNKIKKQFENGKWVLYKEPAASKNTGGDAGQAAPEGPAPGAAPEGPPTSDFEALNMETDRRDIVPSVVSRMQVGQASPSTTRLLPKVKPVARPKDMPLMNRSDVRYTMSDVTGDSPYFSSDIELVNGLAKTPDNNMFKQALMNRLGMDKWDNSTALNRLNYLGIKGNIGGSDRKRLRNLINKGTTIEGTIRKKQGGKLKLIKRYG